MILDSKARSTPSPRSQDMADVCAAMCHARKQHAFRIKPCDRWYERITGELSELIRALEARPVEPLPRKSLHLWTIWGARVDLLISKTNGGHFEGL